MEPHSIIYIFLLLQIKVINSYETKIIGGDDAKKGQFPYQVKIILPLILQNHNNFLREKY